METKHTKGEWNVGELDKTRIWVIHQNGLSSCIAKCDNQHYKSFNKYIDIDSSELEANAKLIAASPLLLDALIEVEKWAAEFGIGSIQYEKIINAIKKATE